MTRKNPTSIAPVPKPITVSLSPVVHDWGAFTCGENIAQMVYSPVQAGALRSQRATHHQEPMGHCARERRIAQLGGRAFMRLW
eukprot:CAMPEP_0174331484 /NCGR_PEP_ID=MMETSP0810-20121108/17512_1 /TAXON_ID=73025 ORGANISM="Eutreptiella gymnastica-like, Strain CCMP1594" /NCGR_SAMPLE_ID=MMETSP0810 /ASSEMBLY_ACC=CAM_ASM_000659 /LENGTH=82 /DNA_ID=CAMNT_0015447275 /DNA_START=501 /DNA_END=746 /DNA_ORIENTATION=-